MPSTDHVSRRRFTRATAGALLSAGIAGCAGDDGGDSPEDTPGDGSTGGTDAGGATDEDPAAGADATDTQTAGPETETDTEAGDDEIGDDTDAEAGDDASSEDLDLREANVVDVAIEDQGDGRFRFDVTLHHDDAGEDGYANWWQVERPDGTRLGRRDLEHAHSQQPFTRWTTVDVPVDVTCVVVRGHDQTHGYGGQAMVVTLDTGATRAVRQGTDPDSFEGTTCP